MDFHGMKMNDLQSNEMTSFLEKETVTKTMISSEDSIEADGIKANQAVSRNAKKVSFRQEIEVFEFTRSAKKRQRNNVRSRSKGPAQDLQQGGIALRRSKRFVSEEGITVAGSNGNVSNSASLIVEIENVCSSSVPRRSKRIGSRGSTQEDCKVRELIALEQYDDKDLTKKLSGSGLQFEKVRRRSMRLAAKIAKSCEEEERLVDIDEKEDELVKNNVNEVSDFEVQETEESHMKDMQDDHTVEKVPKRSRRLVNDIDVQTNTQNQRRSMRLKARLLCSGEESTEERKAKQSKGFVAVDSQEGDPVRNKRKDPLINTKVQTIEQNHRMKVLDVTKVEKSPRRSKRLGKNITLLMDTNVKAVKRDDLEIDRTPRQSRQLKKSVSELLVDGQAQKGDEQQKRTYGNDLEDKNFLKPLKCTALDMGYANANSLKRCLVSDNERDGASDNVLKLKVKDEMQVRVRFTKNYSKNDSSKAAIVVEGNLADKKTNKTLVQSSKRVTRKMERDRLAGMDIETASTQSNLTPKLLDEHPQFNQEEAGGANTEARGSSKKSKTMNQDCTKDKPQGIIEASPSSSETIAAESDMIIENVLELNSKLMEGEYEEKVERDIVLMAMIEEDKEEECYKSE